MKKASYDGATRTAFTQAALDARTQGKSWGDAFKAAQDAGYKGTPGGIKQFLLKKPAAEKASSATAAPAETPATAALAEVKEKKTRQKRAAAAPKVKAAKAPKIAKAPKAPKAPKAAKIAKVPKSPEAAKAPKAAKAKRTRTLYSDATKLSILSAVAEARKSGGWNEALVAAQAAGYKGGLSGLMQFVVIQSKGLKVKKKLGRPKKNATVLTGPITITTGSSAAKFALQSIPAAIRGDFANWVVSKIEKEFKHAVKEKNVDQATAMYLEIVDAQNALSAKIESLKGL